MEAKRKSGLGQDVSVNDIDYFAQVQDDKQSERPKKGMALGVDIGTQFCFAGCIDENEDFISLLPSSGEVAEYGIPTVMAIDSKEIWHKGVNSETVTSGKTAIDKLKDTSFRYREVSPSLKTLMRNGEDDFKVLSSNASYSVEIKQLAAIFIQDLLRNLEYAKIKDAVINKIVVTYPNAASDGQEYMRGIRKAIGEAVKKLLKPNSSFEYKDKFAQDIANHIVVVSEAEVAARALEDKVKGSFATIDVGGGTIDIAYTGNKASPHSDDSWAIQKNLDKILKDKGINSSPFALASFKRKGFAQDCCDDSSALVKCNECTRSGKCVQINGDEELDICSTITEICTYQKDSNINSSFAYIIRKVIPSAIHEQALQSVVLLGGGSHMIFIQEALKKAFSDLGYKDIQYWTITPTKGDGYQVVYEKKQGGKNVNEKNITTANFLAYAAALYGNISSSIATCPLDAKLIPTGYLLSATTSFPYVLAGKHPENKKTIYYTLPDNFSNGDIYYLYPGLWNLEWKADFSKGVLCTVKRNSDEIIHEKITIKGISLDATQQNDDYIDKEVAFVGPKQIEPGFYAVGVRYIGTMEEASDANRLQLYLYKSQGEVNGKPCDPKIDATPYIAEVDKSELSASYKADLKFYDFCKAAIKCEKSPT